MESSLELVDSNDHAARFRISGTLNYDSVIALNQYARDSFNQYRDIELDLSGITYINSAGLALLLEWKRVAENSDKKLKITGAPGKLVDIARISELENILFQE